MFQQIKNFLKKILPPPVSAFNREIERILHAFNETHNIVKDNNRKLIESYEIFEKEREQSRKLLDILEHEREQSRQILALLKNEWEQAREERGRILAETRKGSAEIANAYDQISAMQASILERTTQIRTTIDSANRSISEAVWAQIFNNTITDSTWLNNKSFSPGRWAMGYPELYVIYRILNEARPKRILELGLGQSTRLIGQYALEFEDVEHTIVEHDQEWIAFFQNSFQLSSRSKFLQLDLEMKPYKDVAAVRVFKEFKEALKGQRFDFICIDAPLGSDMNQYSRIDVLEILPDCLADSFIIVLDDYERSGETHTMHEIEEKLSAIKIPYAKGRYNGKKDLCLLASENQKFLCSL